MQKVFLWSSVTYEWTHVTPSSAFVPTTDMQACAPCSVNGISSPSGNERSTMNLAIRTLLAICWRPGGGSPLDARLGRSDESANREKAQAVLSSGAHFWPATLPPGRGNQNRACPGCGGRGCRSSVLRDKVARRS